MKCSELKTGMVVVLRNKMRYKVYLNTGLSYQSNNVLLSDNGRVLPLDEFYGELKHSNDLFRDIVEVYVADEVDVLYSYDIYDGYTQIYKEESEEESNLKKLETLIRRLKHSDLSDIDLDFNISVKGKDKKDELMNQLQSSSEF